MENLHILLWLLVACAATQGAPKHTTGFHWGQGEPQLIDKPLAAHNEISTADRDAILHVLTPEFRDFPSPPAPIQRASQTLVKFIDLNSDGVPEVIAEPVGEACTPTGNCPLYVLQKTGTKYRVILEKGAANTVSIQKTRTNGYLDVVVGMHGSATQQGLFVYQFRQGRYWRTHCYVASFSYLGRDGQIHELEQARITSCQK